VNAIKIILINLIDRGERPFTAASFLTMVEVNVFINLKGVLKR
jgi:hypothetical protein